MSKKSLVYTIAVNGYSAAYRQCIKTQEQYATRTGAEFVVVDRPARLPETALAAWLKVPVMLSGLRAGYDWVTYIDADCAVSDEAPAPCAVDDGQNHVFMGLGRTGRLNSGVMIARGTELGAGFFQRVYDSAGEQIPAEDRAHLKYENGNIIYVSKLLDTVGVLDKKWNNTFDPEIQDYIRHFAGPMREHYKRPLLDEVRYRLGQSLTKRSGRQPANRDEVFIRRLDDLTTSVQRRYSAISSAS
jgi:hypothetical protein